MAAKVFTIPSGEPFADHLVRGIVERIDTSDPFGLADITILVPTRRAARTLHDTFARGAGGSALLPRIQPLGDIDEDVLSFDAEATLSLPLSINPMRRRLLLAALVERWDRSRRVGETAFGFAQAAGLARGLAQFLDEAETQAVDLDRLRSLAEGAFAEHWQQVREFLEFARDEWPKLLAAEGTVDPAKRRNLALAALAERYRRQPLARVVAAGTTGSIPATAELLRVIAQLPNGAIVLPGLDRELDEESWLRLDEGHWQFGLKQLLMRIGVARNEVRDWISGSHASARTLLLRETLRPAPTTDAWRTLANDSNEVAAGLSGLSLIEAANAAEEAVVVALVLREALEEPDRTAALITPDRNLARRVAAELARWEISIDDSAGRPLANTPPGTFLSLLAEAARKEFAPVALLSLIKHPLAAGGMETSAFRRRARDLDRLVLRGPRPDPGLIGIAKAIEAAGKKTHGREVRDTLVVLETWFAGLMSILEPFATAIHPESAELSKITGLHIRTAEALAATHDESGAKRLWHGEAGEAASRLMYALAEGSEQLPAMNPASYPALFRMFAEEVAVRPPFGSHPRLAILGPLEARLMHFDTVVLGSLNEGTWPASPPIDPWLSRPMRKSLGFELPERRIGLAAHDFATLAASPHTILTRSLRSEGSPTVASRWIERLKQLTHGLGISHLLTSSRTYSSFAMRIDVPDGMPTPEARPSPRPPVRLRPRSLSVTEIEPWLRDPYEIYAKRILKLRALDPLDAIIGPLERGSAVHLILERFVRDNPGPVTEDSLRQLLATADAVFAEMAIPHAVLSIWRPKFERAAAWFVQLERARRSSIERTHLEALGHIVMAGPHGPFELRARADRIDVLKDGRAAIIDYKTGKPPTPKQVKLFLAPQLPLEAAILAHGGFPDIGSVTASELAYIRIGGGSVPGEYRSLTPDVGELIRESEKRLAVRIADFDDENVGYISRLAPLYAREAGKYDHLARVLEWSSSGWEDDPE